MTGPATYGARPLTYSDRMRGAGRPPRSIPPPQRRITGEEYRTHARALYGRALRAVLDSGEESGDSEPVRLLVTSRCALILQPDAVAAAGITPIAAHVSNVRARVAVEWIREVRVAVWRPDDHRIDEEAAA